MKFKNLFSNLFSKKSSKEVNSVVSFFNEEELSILKKMNGIKIDSVADEKKDLISKFIEKNVIVKAETYEKLDYFTVATLQSILVTASLSKTGKKSELIDRIKSNISETDLSSNSILLSEIYVLSSLGKEIISIQNQ